MMTIQGTTEISKLVWSRRNFYDANQ